MMIIRRIRLGASGRYLCFSSVDSDNSIFSHIAGMAMDDDDLSVSVWDDCFT